MSLTRLVLSFERDAVVVRVLYRSKNSPNPGTKARRREVTELTRTGLKRALEALEGRVDVIGTSGFETREDTLSAERGAA